MGFSPPPATVPAKSQDTVSSKDLFLVCDILLKTLWSTRFKSSRTDRWMEISSKFHVFISFWRRKQKMVKVCIGLSWSERTHLEYCLYLQPASAYESTICFALPSLFHINSFGLKKTFFTQSSTMIWCCIPHFEFMPTFKNTCFEWNVMSTIVLFKVSFSPALCKSCARQIQRSLNQTSGERTPEGDLKRGVQQNCYGRTVGNWESHSPAEELFKLTTSHEETFSLEA